MGLILPQICEVTISPNNMEYYEKLGYDIPKIIVNNKERVKRGTKIKVHVLDLMNGSHTLVKVQCDECGKIYEMPYKDYSKKYCVQKIGKLFCVDCVNPCMVKYNIASEQVWNDKNYVLKRLDDFIKKNGTLKGWTVNNKEGTAIAHGLRDHNYNLEELCNELGYNYYELREIYYPEGFLYNYDNFKSVIQNFIDENGYFPSQKQMRYDLHIPESIPQRFGGSEKIIKDMNIDKNYLIDDRGFYNRSYYEYILAQFLIHNNIPYQREQHPFPKPYDNFRSDFTFITTKGIVYHLELWGYIDGYKYEKSRANAYLKRKAEKKKLYKKYNINLIDVDAHVFNNSLTAIQMRLSNILSEILNSNLKTVDKQYLINPRGLSNDDLFKSVMKYSNDNITLPSIKILRDKNPTLLNEIILRFDNLGNFAKEYNVRTNNKRKYWNKNTVLDTMMAIKEKYGYIPNSSYIKSNKLYSKDKLFVGFIDATKSMFGNIVNGYISFYEMCLDKGIPLHEKEIEYLNKIITNKYMNKKSVENLDINRVKRILQEVS